MAPKRPAVPSSRSSSSAGPIQKKTRFASPTSDAHTFADEVDSALETSTARKGRVKTEGYESDSSDDGEGVVLSRKKGADGDEDDVDMFGDADAKAKDDAPKKKKKQEFLRLGDIEGQEFKAEGSDEGSADDDEDEPEDEDDAIRRSKAGMGYELSSFNMKAEMEEGKFAEDGTFVRSFDPHAMHDRWMEGVDESDIKKARKAQRRMEKKEQEMVEKEDREERKKEELEKDLVELMRPGEDVVDALARCGKGAKKKKPTKAKEPKQADTKPPELTDVERITDLASRLLIHNPDIYSTQYELLLRSVRSSGIVAPDWKPPVPKFEYKWDLPSGESTGETFGPFEKKDLEAWYAADYFGPGGSRILVRRVGGDWGTWDDVVALS